MPPIRIQLHRKKGWKLPPNSMSVARPGPWGNPCKVVDGHIYLDVRHRQARPDNWVYVCPGNIERAVLLFRYIVTGEIQPGQAGFGIRQALYDDLHYHTERIARLDWQTLRGKNLACFCCPTCVCHADVLLEYANG